MERQLSMRLTADLAAKLERSAKRLKNLHGDCVAALEQWTGPVVTTEAVLTETLYLVGPQWRAQKACLEFVLRGAFHWFLPRRRAYSGLRF